jgi:hypothetical protein
MWTSTNIAQVALGKTVCHSAKARIGGEDEALLVTATEDLQEEVCISIVECEEAGLVNDE